MLLHGAATPHRMASHFTCGHQKPDSASSGRLLWGGTAPSGMGRQRTAVCVQSTSGDQKRYFLEIVELLITKTWRKRINDVIQCVMIPSIKPALVELMAWLCNTCKAITWTIKKESILYIYIYTYIQCGAVITRSVFTQIPTKGP